MYSACFSRLVEGRAVPRLLLVKDFPKEKHNDNKYLVDALDWEGNVDPNFKDNHYLELIAVAKYRERRLGRLLDSSTVKWQASSSLPPKN